MISPTITPIIVQINQNPQLFSLSSLIGDLIGPLVVGLTLFIVGERTSKNKLKSDAIRDLMTLRGDYVSVEFRRALNKVSIVFHDKEEIRVEVRNLYETINNPSLPQLSVKRKIVGLIYKLCKSNGFRGLTEYDIDQAFPETRQEPSTHSEIKISSSPSPSMSPSISASPSPSSANSSPQK